jgi:hypothetical protein
LLLIEATLNDLWGIIDPAFLCGVYRLASIFINTPTPSPHAAAASSTFSGTSPSK